MQSEEKKERHKVQISQKAVIYDPTIEKFLIARVRDEQGWYFKNMGPWEFVGGSLEENETLIDSLQREILEEAGDLDVEALDIINTIEFEARTSYKIFIIYLVKYAGGELRISSEHSEFKWVSAEEIEKNKEHKEWLKESVRKASKYIERENALDSWKRCQADFENYKKSQAAHQEEFRKYAKMDVTLQILPVLDNFEMSLAHVPEKSQENKWVEGIVYIKKQLEDVLRNNDIEEIAVKSGDKFDPEIHEAVAGKGDKVWKVLRKGYRLNGKIIRVARVELGIPEDSVKTRIFQK